MKEAIFKAGMSRLLKSYPEKHFDLELIWDLIKDLTDEQFKKSIIRIITHHETINRATNIIALIRKEALYNINKITAGEAWCEVLKKISQVGSYGQPTFNDPVIKKSVECIGWRNLCTSENISVERAHFFKTFEAMQKREEDRQSQNMIENLDIKLLK